MKLSELKQGMVCEMRNELSFTIVDNDKAFRPDMYFCLSGNYEKNLTHKRDNQHDIMKVSYGDKVVWERKKSTYWEPEFGKKYYIIGSFSDVIYFEYDSNTDEKVFETQLVFKTREEAEKHLLKQQAKIRVIKEIARLNEGWTPNWNNIDEIKCIVGFDESDLYIERFRGVKLLDNNLYLKSYELAWQLIETHEKDLKLMLEVE